MYIFGSDLTVWDSILKWRLGFNSLFFERNIRQPNRCQSSVFVRCLVVLRVWSVDYPTQSTGVTNDMSFGAAADRLPITAWRQYNVSHVVLFLSGKRSSFAHKILSEHYKPFYAELSAVHNNTNLFRLYNTRRTNQYLFIGCILLVLSVFIR